MSENPSHDSKQTVAAAERLDLKTQPWTDEAVSQFWKYENARAGLDSFYFSYQNGPALIALAKEFGLLRGKILDYSAARGHLIDNLIDEPSVSVEAVEYTEEAVNALNQKFQNRPQWNRALMLQSWLDQQARQYDLIFCIEVIEHLIDPHLESTFQELYSSLAPGGAVFFTTPHEECLQDKFTYCPFCSTEFHPVQHVHSFSVERLSESLKSAGFQVNFCHNVDLNLLKQCINPYSWKDRSYNYYKMQLKYRYCKMLDSIAPRGNNNSRLLQWMKRKQGPNLMAIASKPG